MGFIGRWIATAIAVAAALWIVPGIGLDNTTSTWVAVAIVGLMLALLNVSVKPILQIVSLPFSVLTLGIFYLVINTVVLYLASGIANGLFDVGFVITNFGSAFFASIIISIVSSIVNGITDSES